MRTVGEPEAVCSDPTETKSVEATENWRKRPLDLKPLRHRCPTNPNSHVLHECFTIHIENKRLHSIAAHWNVHRYQLTDQDVSSRITQFTENDQYDQQATSNPTGNKLPPLLSMYEHNHQKGGRF